LRPLPTSQTISDKREKRDGTARLRAYEGRSLPRNRRELHREGCLRSGWAGGWQWTCDGVKVACISLHTEGNRLHLTYSVRIGYGDRMDVAESVRIVRVPCGFGCG
jgi:hypothetical protein